MSDDSDQKSIYFNVVLPLNEQYYYVFEQLKRGNCRAKYLRDFQVILGMSTEKKLDEYTAYKQFDEDTDLKLPEESDENPWVTESKYRAVLNIYAEIMREAGLVSKPRLGPSDWGN